MVGQRTRVALEREKMLALRVDQGARVRSRDGQGVRRGLAGDVGPPARARGAADAAARCRRRLPRADRARPREAAWRRTERSPPRAARPRDVSAPTCGDRDDDADAKFCKDCGHEAVNDRGQRRSAGYEGDCDGHIGVLASCVLCVLGVLCGCSVLRAQFQMPDPKQMAGIPRPVDDLPNGTVSVRLIRGQLSNNIAELAGRAARRHGRCGPRRPTTPGARSSTSCRPGAASRPSPSSTASVSSRRSFRRRRRAASA